MKFTGRVTLSPEVCPTKAVVGPHILTHCDSARKIWKYGKTLQLAWGTSAVQTGGEKWTFVFKVVPERFQSAETLMDSQPIQLPNVST